MSDSTNSNFHPTPGHVLILPSESLDQSSMIKVVDAGAKSYKGEVIAVGKNKITDGNALIESPVKQGDRVVYSIAGCERTKLEWEGEKNKEFIVAPFGRILLIIE